MRQDSFEISIQNPVHLDDGSEPEPDIALLRRRPEGYAAAHPTSADVLLAIEVADSSVDYDRNVKAHIYGRAGIPETWVKNLPEDCIERFTEPGPEGYAEHTVHRRGETLTPVSLPELELAVDDLLPPLGGRPVSPFALTKRGPVVKWFPVRGLFVLGHGIALATKTTQTVVDYPVSLLCSSLTTNMRQC